MDNTYTITPASAYFPPAGCRVTVRGAAGRVVHSQGFGGEHIPLPAERSSYEARYLPYCLVRLDSGDWLTCSLTPDGRWIGGESVAGAPNANPHSRWAGLQPDEIVVAMGRD